MKGSKEMREINRKVSWIYSCNDETMRVTAPAITNQSPINIKSNKVEPMLDGGKLVFNYVNSISMIQNTERYIEGHLKGLASINGRTFFLNQFHFHSSGEHRIDDEIFPLELHLVHESQVGMKAVVAVLFEFGEENTTLNQILDLLSKPNEDNRINLLQLLPNSLDYYHYLGSLTTPPITECVEWYVLMDRMTLSREQFKLLSRYHEQNFQELQNLNDRNVLKKIF